MRILAVTNMYPTTHRPTLGIFVQQQVNALKHVGLDVEVLIVDRDGRGRFAYWDFGRQLRAKIAAFHPDLVHVMYGGVMGLIASQMVESAPVVVSFCGSDLLGASLSGCFDRWLAYCGVIASRKAARNASGVVVKSPNLRNALPRDVDIAKVRIIPNGVDLSRFKPLDHAECHRRLHWDADRFHVLFASNSGDPVKRPALAQAAVNELAAQGIRAELHHLSGVPHDNVPMWLNASDVLLLTSITEGSPNVVKEALACDLPVVSVDVGDVHEQIQGVDGCYLASATASDLAAKLRMVHTSGRRVRGRPKMEQLSLTQVALRLKTFYAELLESSRREHFAYSAADRCSPRNLG